MTFGSVFVGIGGFDLGLERAGMTVRWQVEVDAYARRVLERHWPDVPKRGDIRLVDPADLPHVDLICGGFPCQDISSAGKGVGITGRRSGLWKEMLRLVSGLRPRWVLAENVPALRTRGADVVCGDLEAEGYTCWPVVVGAWAVGAPHRRDRVWIIARLGDTNGARREGRGADAHEGRAGLGDRFAGLADAERDALRDEPGWRRGASGSGAPVAGADGLADGDGAGCDRLGRPKLRKGTSGHVADGCRDGRLWPSRPGEAQQEWEAPRTTQPRVGRPASRFSGGLARRLALKALGNAVVPQVAEAIGRAILARGGVNG